MKIHGPKLVVLVALLLCSLPAWSQSPQPPPPTQPVPPPEPPPPPSKWFFGGGLGLSFGDVDYVSVSPMIGYRVTPRFHAALQPFYSHTKDDRYATELSASNYGGDLLGRFTVLRNFFLEGRYEWISYEYRSLAGTDERTTDTYPMAGLGYTMGSGRVGGYFSALYNFGYDEDDPFRPYDSPWVYQAGVGVGF
jgi:hypothetical protein